MSMAVLENLEHKPACILSSIDKAALFDQVWNEDSSKMMVLAQLIFDDAGSPLDYEILDVNSACEKVSGFPREQALGRRLRKIFPGYDPKWPEKYGESVRFGRTLSGIGTAVTPHLVYELKIFPLNTETRLITVRRSLTRLKQSQMLLLQTLALAKEAILLINENEIIMDCNERAQKILGWPKQELIGQSIFNFMDNVDEGAKGIARQKPEGKAVQINEIRCRRRDGTVITVETTTKTLIGPQGQGQGYIVMIRDITKRKRAEEALRLSEEKFSKAFYNSQTILAISRLRDGVYLDVNESWADALGYQREELIGKSALVLNNWAEPGKRQAMLQLLAEKWCIQNYESEYRKKSGELGTTLAAIDVLDIGGEKCLLTSAIDITERKKAEEALRLSEELFFKVFNFNPLPMCVVSLSSRKCMEINEAFIQSSGYSKEELLQNRLSDCGLWPCPDDIANFYELILSYGFAQSFETTMRIKSGKINTGLISGTIINWRGEECLLAVGLDISELKRYEEELARLDRLNLIGQIAAGIGHEIRNPMTTVRGFLQLLMQKDRYAEDLEFLELMIAEIDRANLIITEFLSLARTKNTDMKRQSLNQKIRNLLPLIQAEALKQDKRIEVYYGDIPYILIDKHQIHQLLLNLINNGMEAMTPGGCLTIRTYMEGEGVTLEVTDQGGLIPKAVLDKLGTPFFTTKEGGTGLGLAICYSVAHQHKALIEIENDFTGTTFYVRFKA